MASLQFHFTGPQADADANVLLHEARLEDIVDAIVADVAQQQERGP
jgi:hypothetical protein